jgi:hypothetical protein
VSQAPPPATFFHRSGLVRLLIGDSDSIENSEEPKAPSRRTCRRSPNLKTTVDTITLAMYLLCKHNESRMDIL